jgi:hypothetical protein
MAYEQDSPAFPGGHLLHLAKAFLLELGVTNGQDFVYDQNLWLEMGRDSEGKADIHAGAIALHRRLEELFYVGEGYDLIEFRLNLVSLHAENRAIQINILTSREFGVKAGSNL